MFYSVYVLTKKGFLAPIWTEGTSKNKLSKKQVISSNINDMCVNIIEPKCGPLALRLSAVLLLGITRIHNRQCRYLLSDTNDMFGRVRFQSYPQAVNLTEEATLLRQDKIDLNLDTLHYPNTLLELNITATQMGLDPILDSLNLEDGQLVIGDDSLEGVLLGMATPMSDIPANDDFSLHQLTDQTMYEINNQLLALTNNNQNNEIPAEPEHIDFGFDALEMDLEPLEQQQQQQQLQILTPPKTSTFKRSLPVVKPDTNIEISDEIWKKQNLDLSVFVSKRPAIQLLMNLDDTRPEAIHRPYQDDLVDFLQYFVNPLRTLLPRESVSGSSSIDRRRGMMSDDAISHRSLINENHGEIGELDLDPLEGEFEYGVMGGVESTVGVLDETTIGKLSLSSISSATSTPSHQVTVRLLQLLEEAGLKQQSVRFDEFTSGHHRGFVAKSFYHLLVLGTENHVMLNQQKSYGDIEVSDVVV